MNKKINYWIIKSEPKKYSWDEFLMEGNAIWDGVRNYKARNNLKAMKLKDLAFFYHSNQGLEIKGLAKVSKEFYQDPTTTDARWVAVNFKPVKEFSIPITLKQLKNTQGLENLELIKISRLSVSSVNYNEYKIIMSLL